VPQFYFDVTARGVTLADDEGLDLPSLRAARTEAMTSAAEMAREDEACPKDIVILVRDGERQPLVTVRLSLRCEEVA
jgi:hypothetical protein